MLSFALRDFELILNTGNWEIYYIQEPSQTTQYK